ncbi:polysaccharide pyruvyl transferase family protein [Shinella sp. HZN7]|uniref:polysaccharide pyruvyl transferase family protein n=1 Tax=Shinella sp. (strain HZN7) TaxID=879274 RepID=UPI0007DA69A8|nr:polysaccharide pyruvyl transferase family protein [Shinella sp. HZN7]ANH07921.1 hypothetical protein shn_27635 [Shinella sp. HZN7]
MKIGLLGQFGSGNSGNDGSLEAMVRFLRQARPEARLLCICSNPAKVRDDFALDVVSIRGKKPSTGRSVRSPGAGFWRVPSRIGSMIAIFQALAGTEVLVIPGTGILDDFQEAPFGWPFILFWWCLAARLRGIRIAFVSIGAGPIHNALSRRFLKAAVQMAEYRSYRDDFSLRYVKDLGVDVSRDLRFPDLAFGLRAPTQDPVVDRRPPHAAIGVGVMHYRGWKRGQADGDAIYRTYINKLSAVIGRLLEDGRRVHLFMGDKADETALDDIFQGLAPRPAGASHAFVSVARTTSLDQVMEELKKVDIAIVSRYHNLLCALKTGRPAFSLGYAQKNDELMATFGRAAFCQHIEDFDVEVLIGQVRTALADLDGARKEIEQHNAAIRRELARQGELLLSGILKERCA